jgi:NTP pyrophosphatase (non-canonical NTP hydrolase)
MNPKQYVENVLVTEARDFTPVKDRMQDTGTVRLMHAMIGMATESGEIQDQLKKHIFYGKPLDKTNLVEELGDLMWYVGIMANQLDVSLEEVMEKNIAKLRKRYGEKFTEAAALNRNLDAERKILEE